MNDGRQRYLFVGGCMNGRRVVTSGMMFWDAAKMSTDISIVSYTAEGYGPAQESTREVESYRRLGILAAGHLFEYYAPLDLSEEEAVKMLFENYKGPDSE